MSESGAVEMHPLVRLRLEVNKKRDLIVNEFIGYGDDSNIKRGILRGFKIVLEAIEEDLRVEKDMRRIAKQENKPDYRYAKGGEKYNGN